jgi:hypothetical protein
VADGPIGGIGAELISVSPGLIRGDVHWDVYHDDYLASLSTVERASLLAFDPHGAGSAVEWPRFLFLSEVALVDGMEPVVRGATWWPCADPEEFSVVAQTAVPMSGGDTFVLQYGVQHDASCSPQRPGLLTGTTTLGCTAYASVYGRPALGDAAHGPDVPLERVHAGLKAPGSSRPPERPRSVHRGGAPRTGEPHRGTSVEDGQCAKAGADAVSTPHAAK